MGKVLPGMRIEMFPDSVLALQVEIRKHPELMHRLQDQGNRDFYIHLVEIATHCGILVDGLFTQEDIFNLCDLLVNKLQQKKTILILPMNTPLN